MNKKLLAAILATTLAVSPTAHADPVTAAVGGFILGMIVGEHDRDDNRQPPPPEVRRVPPPYREPRLIPMYKTVCEEWQEYDTWGNLRTRRQCHQEFIGYREI
jgi:hypothetical protein